MFEGERKKGAGRKRESTGMVRAKRDGFIGSQALR
jgi:hypothetical protein